jgi:diguanylate cyclase (GGDEF)-like protein/PAS domain S-box-containing protein
MNKHRRAGTGEVVRGDLAREVLAQSNDALLVFVPESDRIIEANVRACDLLGYSRPEMLVMPVSAIFPNEMPKLAALSQSSPLSETGLIDELMCLTKQGEIIPSEISASVIQLDQGQGIIASLREITERRHAEEELAHQAFHDPLTGLANRQLFLDHLTLALARNKRRRDSLAVLFIDLDRFKMVNDSYGHEAGDEVLISMANRVRAVVRPSDTAARLGGDEFAVLSESVQSETHAITIAKRILRAGTIPFSVQEDEIVLTTSVGIAVSDGGSDRPEVLLRNADAAMYRAKERGKARYEVFDEGMKTRARARLRSETALRQAMERDQFRIHYQPEVDLNTGRIVAAEALVRWQDPERGLLPPRDFLALAEETKLIMPIGTWVLEQACLQAQRWRTLHSNMRSLVIAVNLSARQLNQSDLVDVVARVLSETGTAPSTLCLEITESAVMEDVDSCTEILHRLKSLGVSIAIDDLGLGYSSLSFLRRLPVDTVKVDQSFVQGLSRDPADLAIVSAVISMAGALELTAIAEGVETVDQRDVLSSLTCPRAQGFYFAPPQPDTSLGELLTQGSLG